MTRTTARPQLDGENPWPGLESFQEDERAFFFGRERESAALLEHVLDAAVTVLYGRSGLGKTSLLRAGLFPRLREQCLLPEQRFLPVYVRFEVKPGAPPLAHQLHQSVHNSIRAELPVRCSRRMRNLSGNTCIVETLSYRMLRTIGLRR